MFIVNSYALAVILCFVTMLCWGSWGNTQKLAAKSWRYELFYWDYVIGMVLFALLLAFTAGSIGSEGRPFLADLAQASASSILWILLGGVAFTIGAVLYLIGAKRRYIHSLFHVFVIAGCVLQFFGILFYVL